jgi:PAS domain S-box-containing protein
MDDRQTLDCEMDRLLAEHVTDQCIYAVDMQGRVDGWNAGAERLFGYAESEILGRGGECLFTANDLARGAPDREMQRALTEQRLESERWQLRKDGSKFWSSVVTIGLFDADGQPRGVARIVRDRTKARQQLADQQERLRLALEAGRMGTWEWNIQTGEVVWADSLLALHGFDSEDFGGTLEAFQRLVHPDDLPTVQQAIAHAIENHASYDAEFRILWTDGSVHWMAGKGQAFYNEQGVPLRMVGIGMDITERRQAAAQLRQSEERFRGIVSHSIAGVAEVDLTGRFLFANDQYCKIVGRSLDELRTMSWPDISHPDDVPSNKTLFEKIIRDGAPYIIEKRYLRPDGSQVWVNNSVSALYGPHGQVQSVAGVCVDVTARRQAEVAHRDDERRLRALIDNLPNGAVFRVVQDLRTNATRFTFISAGLEQMLGITAEAGLADSTLLYGAIHEEDRQRVLAEEVESQRTLRPFDSEMRVRHRSGEVRWLHCRAAPHRSSDPEVVWDGVTLDVTARKQAEESLREADRRKDEFLAMLGHELRNPLAPIRTGLEILSLEQDSDIVRLMTRQVDHLVRLVDDLLDVSRIMRGKIILRREPVELARVIAQAIEISRPAIDGQHHQLTRSLPAEPVWLDCDPIRLAQVFGNLLNNAAKYTPPHGQIWLSAEREDDFVVVRVRDNGPGIEAPLLPHVFDLFKQGERTIDRSQGGLGIGLTVVRRITEMHGGTVAVRSDGLGQGSEFVVRLPILVNQDLAPAAQTLAQREQGYRMLVVDDNAAAATALEMLLKRIGPNEVRVAHDGPSTLAAVASDPPEIILLDIGLPGMSGLEVARLLRSDPQHANILLVALTGFGTSDDRQATEEVGFDAHLVKPADMAALQALFVHPKLAASSSNSGTA